MKRCLAVCILIVITAFPVFSQDSSFWQAGTSVQYTSSFNFRHISLDVFALFGIGDCKIGCGLKPYIGLNYNALFLGAYFRVELGWFYFGMGPLFIIVQPDDPAFELISKPLSVMGFSGMTIPIVQHENGKFVVTASLEASGTPVLIFYPDTGSLGSDLIIGLFGNMFNLLFTLIKFNVGLGYYHYF